MIIFLCAPARSLFTFHYVSISTCSNTNFFCKLPHLHSTMYLFQQGLFQSVHQSNTHLHSTMYLFQPKNRSGNDEVLSYIYIPLCIYFNHYSTFSLLHHHCIFTFHYVSISTDAFEVPPFFKSNIYIPLCIYFNLSAGAFPVVSFYLHSTMYLFQPPFCQDSSIRHCHLHSTMYLFQPLAYSSHDND